MNWLEYVLVLLALRIYWHSSTCIARGGDSEYWELPGLVD
jgi:hypothetical protein